MSESGWPEVDESALQRWLDTRSPDYTLHHDWGENLMVCYTRRTNERIAYQRNSDKRCFVHPDFLEQVK